MITYPLLQVGATIGVTAPSSGVKKERHSLIELATQRLEAQNFRMVVGDTTWTQDKAKSAPAKQRAVELQTMMQDDSIDMVIPPWGGELFIELLAHLDFDTFQPKWILGYSDTSGLLLAMTLTTGIATAHGTNFIDLRGEYVDDTTAMWSQCLQTEKGGTITQSSSKLYQEEWKFDDPSPDVFHFTKPTYWKSMPNQPINITGRLLGGCIDIIRHLIGTPYGDVRRFQEKFISNEPLIWYVENCHLYTTDLRRTLIQMKLAGWFDHCAGILFGRSDANQPIDNYGIEDVYQDLLHELQVPIIYDIDCGHLPPQITFINGAYAEITVLDGKGTVKQIFRP